MISNETARINNDKMILDLMFQVLLSKMRFWKSNCFPKIHIFSNILTQKALALHYEPSVFVIAAPFMQHFKLSSRSRPCHSVMCCRGKSSGCVNVFMNAWFCESVYLALSSCCLITGNPSCECVCVFVCLCKAEARRGTEAKLGPSQASAQRAETKKPPAVLSLSLSLSLSISLFSTGIWK